MTLREFRRRTLGWDGGIELTLAFDGRIYTVGEFCGYVEKGDSETHGKRETICFIPRIDGQD